MQAEVEFEIGVYCVPVFFPLLSECWGRAGERIWGLFGLVGLGLVLGPVVRLVFGFLLGGFFWGFF